MDPAETRRRAIAKLHRRAKEQAVIDAARAWETGRTVELAQRLVDAVRALDGEAGQ